MKYFVGSFIFFLILAFYIYRYYLAGFDKPINKDIRTLRNIDRKYALIVFAAGFVLRIFISLYNSGKGFYGFGSDISSFSAWAKSAYETGLTGFYTSGDYTSCPPGYVYILFFTGALINIFKITEFSSIHIILIKLPAILADCGTAFLCYKMSGEQNNIKRFGALTVSLLILLNPLTLINSALWGANDAVFVFFLVFALYMFTRGKTIPGYFLFTVSALMSPLAVFYLPVFVFAFVNKMIKIVKAKKDLMSKTAVEFFLFVTSISSFFVLCIPLGIKESYARVTDYFSMKYASVNAYNFWELIGKGWLSEDETMLGISISVWGAIFVVLVLIGAAFVFVKAHNSKSVYFFTAGLLSLGIFTLATRMHERFLFPAAILFIFAFVIRPRTETYLLVLITGAAAYFNIFHVLYYFDAANYSSSNPVIKTIASFCVVALIFAVITAVKVYILNGEEKTESRVFERMLEKNKAYFERIMTAKTEVRHTQKISKMNKYDYIIVAVIMSLYSILAFYHLGNMYAPTTEYSLVSEGAVTLDFGEVKNIRQMWAYLGHEFDQNYVVTYSEDGEHWYYLFDDENNWQTGAVYNWNLTNVDVNTRFLYIAPASTTHADAVIEFVFKDINGKILTPVNAENYHNLFDEQQYAVESDTYLSGTYFDEVHYTRHIHEMKNGLYTYENTHPQLGKEIMAIGTYIFGMNPFGWRFMGTVCGIIMIFAMYVLAKKFFADTKLATVTTLVFTSDFMHFVQTRIATIDVYAVMFIMLSYIFIYEYTQYNFFESPLKKTYKPLFLCGLFAGLAISSKWIGVYSAAGIAFILLVQFVYRYKEYSTALVSLDRDLKKGKDFDVVRTFNSNVFKTVGWCFVVFIFIPLIIYTLTYIPFNDGVEGRDLITKMIEAQKTMFNYHTGLVATHSYSSEWYQWPVIFKPVLYVIETVSATVRRDIVLMGNPAIWWAGIPVSLYMIWLWINEKDRKAGFLLVGYLAQYLPWTLVERYTFIYHYFASIPFITIMCVYACDRLGKRFPKLNKTVYVYCAICLILFFMFLPILNGSETSVWYIEHFLKWSKGWAM